MICPPPLNYISSLLSLNISQVDSAYILNPSSRLSLDNETRIHMTSTELKDKQQEMVGQQAFTETPKFPTECFFLTTHCAYIAWTSFIRRHSSSMRDLRHLRGVVSSMEAAKKSEEVGTSRISCHALMALTNLKISLLWVVNRYRMAVE